MERTLPTISLFVEGTFLPSREGATKRFLGVARNLAQLGHKVVVIHCYRGWSDLARINAEKFITYAMAPDVYYGDLPRIAAILRSECVDVMQFAEIETIHRIGLPLKAQLPQIALAYECHDVHSTFLQSIGASKEQVDQTIHIEEHVLQCCDLIFCFTAQDQGALRRLGADSRRISVVPFGIDTQSVKFRGPCLTERTLLFLGNLYHWPNREALQHIVTFILPKVRRLNPPCRVTIVGDYPREMESYANLEGLQMLGMVDNLDEPFSTATLAIAPITSGSGIKVKLLDYFAAGLPTVGTELAFRGFPCSAGAIISDIASMPAVIKDLLDRSALLAKRGHAAREVAEQLDWRNIRRSLSALYVNAISRHTPPMNCTFNHNDNVGLWARPYFLEDNFSQGRFDPRPYPPISDDAIVRLGPAEEVC